MVEDVRTTTGGPVIVEFIGLPGAGKTTLARGVMTALAERGVACAAPMGEARGAAVSQSRLAGIAAVIGHVLRRPRIAFRSASLIAGTRQPNALDLVKVTHNWLRVSAHFESIAAGRQGDRVEVFDQGIYQALWSIAYRAGNEALSPSLLSLAACVPPPDLVVDLEVAVSAARHRLGQRSGLTSRLQWGSGAATSEDFQQAAHALELVRALVRTAAKRPAPRVVKLDTTGDASLYTNVRAVVTAVLSAAVPTSKSPPA